MLRAAFVTPLAATAGPKTAVDELDGGLGVHPLAEFRPGEHFAQLLKQGRAHGQLEATFGPRDNQKTRRSSGRDKSGDEDVGIETARTLRYGRSPRRSRRIACSSLSASRSASSELMSSAVSQSWRSSASKTR